MGLSSRLALTFALCFAVLLLLAAAGCGTSAPEQPTAVPTIVALSDTPAPPPTEVPPTETPAPPTAVPPTPIPPTPTAVPTQPTPPPPTPVPTVMPTPVKVNIQATKLDSGWTLYDNLDDGFGIALPPTWMQIGLDEESLQTLLGASEDDPEGQLYASWMSSLLTSYVKLFGVELAADASKSGFPPMMNVVKTRLPGNLTLDGLAAASVQALGKTEGVSKPITHKRVRVSNADAEMIQYRISYGSPSRPAATPSVGPKQFAYSPIPNALTATPTPAPLTMSMTQYLILDGKDAYAVTLATTADQEKKYAPTFAKIGQSFRLGWPPRLVLTDDFSDPDEGLFAEDDGTDEYKLDSGVTLSCQWSYSYSNKALVAQVKGSYPKGADGYMCGHGADAYEEMPDRFAVEVRAKATKSTAAARYGIRLYSNEASDVFELVVSPASGSYNVSHYMGKWEVLAKGTSAAIKRGNSENVLRLEVRGDTLIVIVNGQELKRVQHPKLPMKSTSVLLDFYLAGKPAEGYVEVRYSQFKVFWLGPA